MQVEMIGTFAQIWTLCVYALVRTNWCCCGRGHLLACITFVVWIYFTFVNIYASFLIIIKLVAVRTHTLKSTISILTVFTASVPQNTLINILTITVFVTFKSVLAWLTTSWRWCYRMLKIMIDFIRLRINIIFGFTILLVPIIRISCMVNYWVLVTRRRSFCCRFFMMGNNALVWSWGVFAPMNTFRLYLCILTLINVYIEGTNVFNMDYVARPIPPL